MASFKCLVTRITGGLLVRPTAANLTEPSDIEIPPVHVATGTALGKIPYATLEKYVGKVVVLDAVVGVVAIEKKK